MTMSGVARCGVLTRRLALGPQCRSRLHVLGDAGVYHEKAYAPSMKAIKDKYYELFRGDTEQAAGSSSDAADPSTPK